MMYNGLEIEVLIEEEEIKKIVKDLANKISKDYEGKKPVMLGILNGAFIFMADLIRAMSIPVEVEFIRVKSYVGSETSGEIKVLLDVENVKDKDVVIVEDIVDTGLTVKYIVDKVKGKGAKSVKVCSLLDKPSRRKVDVKIDYVGFEIPDHFVVGYGLDYNGMCRELPAIYRVISL